MATAKIPEGAQFSAAAEHRNTMYTESFQRLQHLAWRALNILEKRNNEVVIVCIQVDSHWRNWVDELMPHHDWDSIRATGAEPIARGILDWSACAFIALQFPDIADIVFEVPPVGRMKVIVLDDGGCTVYEIEPKGSLN